MNTMNAKPGSWTTGVLLAALLPWLGACCTTEVRLSRTSGAGAAARLDVRVFETRKTENLDLVTDRRVVTELYQLAGSGERLIRKETTSRWSAEALEPGRYLLRVSEIGGDDEVASAPGEVQEETLRVRAGERTVADVVLKDPHKARVAAAWTAVGVTAAAVLVYQISHMEVIGDLNLNGR